MESFFLPLVARIALRIRLVRCFQIRAAHGTRYGSSPQPFHQTHFMKHVIAHFETRSSLRSVKCKSSTHCTWRPIRRPFAHTQVITMQKTHVIWIVRTFTTNHTAAAFRLLFFRQSGEIALYMGDDINGGLHTNACLEIDKPNVRLRCPPPKPPRLKD